MNVNCVRDGLTPIMIITARWTIKNSWNVVEFLLNEFENEIDLQFRAKKSRLYKNLTVFEIAKLKQIDNQKALELINEFVAKKNEKKNKE